VSIKYGKPDSNQPGIVHALTDAYASVLYLTAVGGGAPDLLVGRSMPCPYCTKLFKQNKLIEVKTAVGKLRPEQQIFHQSWNGQIAVARNINEALAIAGGEAERLQAIRGEQRQQGGAA
jgi:hypothetical protein